MNAKLILFVLLVLLVAPAMAIATDYEIVSAIHTSGNCTFSDDSRTRFNCDIARQDVTAKVQAIANGNPMFRFDTRRVKGGLFTLYGLAWQMPTDVSNYQYTTVVYRVNGGRMKQLGIRDRCWFNLANNRVWCPAITLMDGLDSMGNFEVWG